MKIASGKPLFVCKTARRIVDYHRVQSLSVSHKIEIFLQFTFLNYISLKLVRKLLS